MLHDRKCCEFHSLDWAWPWFAHAAANLARQQRRWTPQELVARTSACNWPANLEKVNKQTEKPNFYCVLTGALYSLFLYWVPVFSGVVFCVDSGWQWSRETVVLNVDFRLQVQTTSLSSNSSSPLRSVNEFHSLSEKIQNTLYCSWKYWFLGRKLRSDHMWLSIVSRPTRSSFSRMERVSCCVALLFLTMISNCMFFQSEDRQTNVQVK